MFLQLNLYLDSSLIALLQFFEVEGVKPEELQGIFLYYLVTFSPHLS